MFQTTKDRLLLLLSAVASILVPGVLSANTPWLSVSGKHIVQDPQGNNVELRGVSLLDVAEADSRPRNTSQVIDMVTNEADGWHARIVRFPVYPKPIDQSPGWNADPDAYFTNHLDPAIRACVAKQIYCIIDWHYISDYTSSEIDTATRNFWSYVAPKYASIPNVIFELFNEPIYPDDWSTWKSQAQPWVDLIRSFAPDNLILIGGPRWSQNLSSAASQPFIGSNLVYVAHIYPQHGGQSTWDAWFGTAADSVPFFITEWGWQQGGNMPTSGTTSGFGIPFSDYLKSKNLSWTAWVFDQWWQPVMIDTNYNLLGGENYMGEYTKYLLQTPPGPPMTLPTTPPMMLPTTLPTTSPPPGVCTVNYVIRNDWGIGATVDVTFQNNAASDISGWTLVWTFPGNQQITNLWSGSFTQSGASVSVGNLSWNANIGSNGGTFTFGFNLKYSGTNAVPVSFSLNGASCG